MGAAVLALLPAGSDRGVPAILARPRVFNLAVVVRTVGAVWEHLPPDLEAAAATLGASPWRAFREITLPLLRPAILAAAVDRVRLHVHVVRRGPRPRRRRHVDDRGRDLAPGDAARRHRRGGDAGRPAARSLIGAVVAWSLVAAAPPQPGARRCGRSPRRQPPAPRRQRALVAVTAVGTAVVVVAPLRRARRALAARQRRVRRWPRGARSGGAEVRPGRRPRRSTRWRRSSRRCARRSLATALAVVDRRARRAGHHRRPARLGRLLDTGLMLPIATSAVTIGFGMLITFDQPPVDWRASWWLVPDRPGARRRARSSCAPCCPCCAASTPTCTRPRRRSAPRRSRAWREVTLALPAPARRRRRRARRGDLARRVRRHQLPVPQRRRDDADRHRAAARPHRRACCRPRAYALATILAAATVARRRRARPRRSTVRRCRTMMEASARRP